MHTLRDASILLFLFFLIILFYQLHYKSELSIPIEIPILSKSETFKIVSNEYSSLWYQKYCFKNKLSQKLVLENLPQYLNNARVSTNKICQQFATKFDALFRLEEIYGLLKLSPVYLNKINQWLHNDELLIEQIKKQRIIKIYNRYTHEEMLYNYMRSQRPQTKNEISPEEYTSKLLQDSKKNCDFCSKNYLNSTAEDRFGRLEHRLSYTAANTFKYDRWHTLVVSRNHDTLHLTEAEIVDMFELVQEWLHKAYSIEPMYTCPEMIWDAMPKSGASQMHTHLQASLGFDIYYGNIERTRQGARFYAQRNNGRNYFNDYLYIHQVLGLTIPIGNAHIIIHLTPIKDLEIMIMDEKLNKNFYKALHLVLRTFVDDLNEYSFSFGMYLPPMNESSADRHEMPVVCRLVFRNSVTNLRSDMNGLDLYTSSVIGKDRYVLYQQLKEGIEKRQK
ncbi:unnamed protein product [Rotaria sordida]|uniref:Galactose-1-phosphate uridylyltransferase n=1 Tax=Rotaria sordida TaxID=392033 RepID=A0A818KDD6_9BILA|nr:unnamed protein product [Rotaria sordida]CAF1290834.1 unnamed protein product [Rotaria sordida]CAF3552562.1 unnamed protein product [Rotaria sordida]